MPHKKKDEIPRERDVGKVRHVDFEAALQCPKHRIPLQICMQKLFVKEASPRMIVVCPKCLMGFRVIAKIIDHFAMVIPEKKRGKP